MQPFGWTLKSSSEIRSGFAERNGLISPSELYYHTISAHPSELGGSPWWNENGIKFLASEIFSIYRMLHDSGWIQFGGWGSLLRLIEF